MLHFYWWVKTMPSSVVIIPALVLIFLIAKAA